MIETVLLRTRAALIAGTLDNVTAKYLREAADQIDSLSAKLATDAIWRDKEANDLRDRRIKYQEKCRELEAKLAAAEKELDSHRSSLGDKITECDALHEELSQMQWGTPVHKRRADEAEKRIAEVEKERDGYRATLCVINDQKPPMSDREAILREALEAIERRVVHCISEWGLEVREIARAALAAKL